MRLFLKGMMIGLGKIIPGVSGALIAINLGVYERLIDAITHFFDNRKSNLKFLLLISFGIISAIIFGSRIIIYLFENYRFITMMFFVGLISGGTYNFSKQITYNKQNIIIIIITIILLLSLTILNIDNNYQLKNNGTDNLIFFLGGVVEVFSSLIPGISGTSLLMIIGIYHHILFIVSRLFNVGYVMNNFNLYLSYGLGMFVSLIVGIKLISYLINKHKNITYTMILGLSLASIITLVIMTLKLSFSFTNLIVGIMLLTIGVLVSIIFDK